MRFFQSCGCCATIAAVCPPEEYPQNTKNDFSILELLAMGASSPDRQLSCNLSALTSNHCNASMTSFCISSKDVEPCPANSTKSKLVANEKTKTTVNLPILLSVSDTSSQIALTKNAITNAIMAINSKVNMENNFGNEPRCLIHTQI